jgi:hypothetical protein
MTTPYIKMKEELEDVGLTLKCPSCGSNVKHLRVDDGSEGTTFQPNGDVVVDDCFSKSNGSDTVECVSCDEEIPDNMQEIIIYNMS